MQLTSKEVYSVKNDGEKNYDKIKTKMHSHAPHQFINLIILPQVQNTHQNHIHTPRQFIKRIILPQVQNIEDSKINRRAIFLVHYLVGCLGVLHIYIMKGW